MNGKRVGLLYDSISKNTGDIAIGIALQQVLTKKGIKTEIIDPFHFDKADYDTIIVGGGQLLRNPGDDFYDAFRVEGKYILNSVGVSGDKDFGYLEQYRYLSARSTEETAVLAKYVKREVKTLPCTTTLLESPKFNIPGITINKGEKVVGIHLVPDILIMCPDIIEIINKIPHKKVFIPFTHYNEDASFMKSVPFDMTNATILNKLDPLKLHSVISQMSYVIVSSLHASIFAYSQNVPFITMYQEKTLNYFKDRGLGEWVFDTQDKLRDDINRIENSAADIAHLVEKDREAVQNAINEFADIILSSPAKTSRPTSPKKVSETKIKELELQVKQLRLVVEKRDVLIHNLIYQGIRSVEKEKENIRALRVENETLQRSISPLAKKIAQKYIHYPKNHKNNA